MVQTLLQQHVAWMVSYVDIGTAVKLPVHAYCHNVCPLGNQKSVAESI